MKEIENGVKADGVPFASYLNPKFGERIEWRGAVPSYLVKKNEEEEKEQEK